MEIQGPAAVEHLLSSYSLSFLGVKICGQFSLCLWIVVLCVAAEEDDNAGQPVSSQILGCKPLPVTCPPFSEGNDLFLGFAARRATTGGSVLSGS